MIRFDWFLSSDLNTTTVTEALWESYPVRLIWTKRFEFRHFSNRFVSVRNQQWSLYRRSAGHFFSHTNWYPNWLKYEIKIFDRFGSFCLVSRNIEKWTKFSKIFTVFKNPAIKSSLFPTLIGRDFETDIPKPTARKVPIFWPFHSVVKRRLTSQFVSFKYEIQMMVDVNTAYKNGFKAAYKIGYELGLTKGHQQCSKAHQEKHRIY